METLKNLTLVQWIGIAVGLNSLLMGATPQLTVLIGADAVPYVTAVATLGNGALGVFATMVGGLGVQAQNVVAGGATIAVRPSGDPGLVALAADPAARGIAPAAPPLARGVGS